MASDNDKEKQPLLTPLLSNLLHIRKEAKHRRKQYINISVDKEEIASYEEKGWETDEELKKKTRLKKLRAIDERLENRFWFLLYKLGYSELNQGRNFQILIERKGASPIPNPGRLALCSKRAPANGRGRPVPTRTSCEGSPQLGRRGQVLYFNIIHRCSPM